MSLELSGTNPLVVARSGIPGTNSINLYDGNSEKEIPMDDFCCLVEYALTNTDLLPDDPRLKLIDKIKLASTTEGYNPGNTRIVLP
jgi:hypothetical protein